MQITLESLKVGDKMRFSTELLQQIEDSPYHQSQTVEIVKIEEDVFDGVKTVYVCNLKK